MFNYYLRKKKLCEREGELVNNMARINAELATIIFVTSSKNGSKSGLKVNISKPNELLEGDIIGIPLFKQAY